MLYLKIDTNIQKIKQLCKIQSLIDMQQQKIRHIMYDEDIEHLKQKYREYQKNHVEDGQIALICQHDYSKTQKSQLYNIPKYILIIAYKNETFIQFLSVLNSTIQKITPLRHHDKILVFQKNIIIRMDNFNQKIGDKFQLSKSEDKIINLTYFYYSEAAIENDFFESKLFIPVILFIIIPIQIITAIGSSAHYIVSNIGQKTMQILPFQNKNISKSQFKKGMRLQQRKIKYEKYIKQNPDKVPVIVQKHHLSTLPNIGIKIFQVTSEKSFQMLKNHIKDQIKEVDSKNSIYIFSNGKLLNESMTMKEIQEQFREQDGFVYLTYQQQESF